MLPGLLAILLLLQPEPGLGVGLGEDLTVTVGHNVSPALPRCSTLNVTSLKIEGGNQDALRVLAILIYLSINCLDWT